MKRKERREKKWRVEVVQLQFFGREREIALPDKGYYLIFDPITQRQFRLAKGLEGAVEIDCCRRFSYLWGPWSGDHSNAINRREIMGIHVEPKENQIHMMRVGPIAGTVRVKAIMI